MDNQKKTTKKVAVIESSCPKCGSDLSFDPKTQNLTCRNCNYQEDIKKNSNIIEEYDFQSALNKFYNKNTGNLAKQFEIKCDDCGATILIDPKAISTVCPFCNSNKTVKQAITNDDILIEGIIPFKIAADEVQNIFKKWISKRFWAPRKFKNGKSMPTYSAFYIPFWTYDAKTFSSYTAMRGDYYYVTVRTRVNGKTVTRQERRTRWTPVSGNSNALFDDVIVRGTTNVLNEHIDNIKNYDLKNELIKYDEKYLLGYYAEKPAVDLENSFTNARKVMSDSIHNQIRREIGGDVVSNLKVHTTYDNITFKQIMCPIYNGTYKYKNKTYHFVMNAQSSAISADYPKSILKIISLVLIIGLIVIGIFLLIGFNY